MDTITIILVLVVGVIIGSVFHFHKKESGLLLGKWKISKQSREKEENKEKILEYLKSNRNSTDEQVNKITNDDVERLVKVSNATAERYLDELEKEAKIEQIGKTGNAVYYQLI